MRKALGARRGQLVGQFLSESMVTVALALALAAALVAVLLPAFNALAGKALTLAALRHAAVPLGAAGTVVLVGLLAGAYPAFYLSAFGPARVLKGASAAGPPAAARVRKGLVVFQFTVSIVLLIGTIVVYRQLQYARQERLGFDKAHVVAVPLRELASQLSHEALREAWRRLPGVASVTASSGMPGLGGGLYDFFVFPEGAAGDSVELMTLTVDHDYAETYGLALVAGRDFDERYAADATGAFLINERAAQRLGWADPVGRKLRLKYYFQGEREKEGTVVGVVRDFQYHSLHQAFDPILFHILPGSYYYDYLSVRLRPGQGPAALAAMDQVWRRFHPERPFEYTFVDARFDALYRAEARLGRLLGVFAGLAALVACLGLFGLAAYTAEQRTREIGIRKALGASVPGIVVLLSKDFVRLVALAFVLAAPLAYVAMHRWLDGFADRVALSAWMFAAVGLSALAVALLTVSYQAVRAALTDPVQALRHE
jgi:putative ABC transport system permease protein